MYSPDGKIWTVDAVNSSTSDRNPANGKLFMFGEFMVTTLREGDVLLKWEVPK